MANQTFRAFLLLCLLRSTIFAAELQDLISASNDFEVAMIEHEHVLERNPSATELAASTLKHERWTECYFDLVRKMRQIAEGQFVGLLPIFRQILQARIR
jgi:hypothetical protein